MSIAEWQKDEARKALGLKRAKNGAGFVAAVTVRFGVDGQDLADPQRIVNQLAQRVKSELTAKFREVDAIMQSGSRKEWLNNKLQLVKGGNSQ